MLFAQFLHNNADVSNIFFLVVILTLTMHNNNTTPRHNGVGSMCGRVDPTPLCLSVVSLLCSVSVLIISFFKKNKIK
jgi:hypothetical protein